MNLQIIQSGTPTLHHFFLELLLPNLVLLKKVRVGRNPRKAVSTINWPKNEENEPISLELQRFCYRMNIKRLANQLQSR